MDKPKEFYKEYNGGKYNHQNAKGNRQEIYDGMVIEDNIGNYGKITIEIKGNKMFAKNQEGENIFLNGVSYFGDEDRPYFTKKDGLTVLAVDLPGVNRYFLEDGSIYKSSSKLDDIISGTKNIIKRFTRKNNEEEK